MKKNNTNTKIMKLSENFNLYEFTKSNIAMAKGIQNTPSTAVISELQKLVINLLQPLRNECKYPFHINSGYRNLSLNHIVGGVPTSQHTKGQAADIKVHNPQKLLERLLETNLDFDQAILYPTFLHLSYNEKKNRRQVLYAEVTKK